MQQPFARRDRTRHPPAYTPTYKTSVLRSPRSALLSLEPGLAENTGPVFHPDGLGPLDDRMSVDDNKPVIRRIF